MSEHFYLGIDGGGTSCRARITDKNHNIIGESVTGSANLFQNPEGTFSSIVAAALEATKDAKIELTQLIAGIGLAGAGLKATKNILSNWNHPFKDAFFATDAQTACIGAHELKPGAILIIGTGVCGWIESESESTSISGWGFPVADQGSGAWMGLRAIQETFNTLDNIAPDSRLSKMVLKFFDESADQIPLWSKTATSADFGQFAPMVIQAGREGDSAANQILDEQIDVISRLLVRIQSSNHGHKIALMGGLSDHIRNIISPDITQFLTQPKSDALNGAILMAQQKYAEKHPVNKE